MFANPKTKAVKDEIELLTLLIEKYDEQHNTSNTEDISKPTGGVTHSKKSPSLCNDKIGT